MFSKNEYVFHESGGVCVIADIQFAPLDNMPSDRQYYIIRPLHDPNSMIYIPVDSDCIFLRRLLNREEAETLLGEMSSVSVIEEPNAKLLRAKYVEAMRSHQPIEWVRVIKTVSMRGKLLAARSQRLSETERSFAENAKRHLYGELAIALGKQENEMEGFLAEYLMNPA